MYADLPHQHAYIKKKNSQVQLVPVNDLQEIQPLARNVMGNSQKADSSGVSYCLRQK